MSTDMFKETPYSEAVVDNSGTNTEANECDRPLPLLSSQQHLSQLLAHLGWASTAHTPRVVYDIGQPEYRSWPRYSR